MSEISKENVKSNNLPQYKGTGEICNKILHNKLENDEIGIVTNYGPIEGGARHYSILIDNNIGFLIEPVTKKIYEIVSGPEFPDPGGFGTFIPIGYLEPEDFQKNTVCGKEYITRKVFISGVDIVRRIGNLLSDNISANKKTVESICQKFQEKKVNSIPNLEISASVYHGAGGINEDGSFYRLNIGGNDFKIDVATGNVISNPFSTNEVFLGKLK